MNDTKRRIIPVYILLIAYLFIDTIIRFTSISKAYINILNPILLLSISILTYFLTIGFRNKNRNKYSKIQNVIIIILFYIILYYLSGLIFGFVQNGYSLSIKGIISNFFSFYIIVFLKEYIRYKMLCTSKKNTNLILITILFILIDIDFNYLFNIIGNNISLFSYFMEGIIPIIILNITLSYLSYHISYVPSMLYRGVISAITIFSPILSNYSWIINNFFYLLVLFLCISSLDRLILRDDKRTRGKENKKTNPLSTIIFIIGIFIFLLFVIGVFKYKPVAIMSNSMEDYFSRGDAVIVEKLSTSEKEEVKEGDVIYYLYNGEYITHRVVKIVDDIIYTKGDNNDTIDIWTVKRENVEGIIRFKIKYIGWPSVWLYELLS